MEAARRTKWGQPDLSDFFIPTDLASQCSFSDAQNINRAVQAAPFITVLAQAELIAKDWAA
jgi:hypothetical protein